MQGVTKKYHRHLTMLDAATLKAHQVLECDELAGSVCIDQRGHIIANRHDGMLLEIH